MKEVTMYCGKDDSGNYVHFYPNKPCVNYCGHKEIFWVKIRECVKNEKNTHYRKEGVEICFPYGVKIMEENKEGKLLPVVVELI